MRPALGTFVRISATAALPQPELDTAVDAAFGAIEHVERAMSFHRADSALHALHRSPTGAAQTIDAGLWQVLALAQRLWRDSDGIFDPSLAPRLVADGLLPVPEDVPPADRGAGFETLELTAPLQAKLRARIWLDLGGIAKGHAVDAALDTLRARGVTSASVNAGGDLACFGVAEMIGLRDPRTPTRLCQRLELCDAALATSAGYFNAHALRGRRGAPTRRRHGSVSVIATHCALADGLTKIVWASPQRAAPLLAGYAARALLIDRRGGARWLH